MHEIITCCYGYGCGCGSSSSVSCVGRVIWTGFGGNGLRASYPSLLFPSSSCGAERHAKSGSTTPWKGL